MDDLSPGSRFPRRLMPEAQEAYNIWRDWANRRGYAIPPAVVRAGPVAAPDADRRADFRAWRLGLTADEPGAPPLGPQWLRNRLAAERLAKLKGLFRGIIGFQNLRKRASERVWAPGGLGYRRLAAEFAAKQAQMAPLPESDDEFDDLGGINGRGKSRRRKSRRRKSRRRKTRKY